MTPAQRDAILKVIDEDAEIQGVLCRYQTEQMCILGGLASAAGIYIGALRGAMGLSDANELIVEEFFGLSSKKQETLVNINDHYNHQIRGKRQAALRKRVKSWKVSDA